MLIALGTVRTEMPDGWVDHSVLQFTGPATGEGPAPTIVVTRSEPPEESFDALIDRQLAIVADTMIGVEELRRYADGEARVTEYRLGDAPPLAQLLGLRSFDRTLFVVTGTAPLVGLDELRNAFLNVLRKLEPLDEIR